MGIFSITELLPDGTEARRFVWTSAREATTGSVGGARACPLKTWELGITHRTKRTDYPGGTEPTEQMLGPSREPFTIRGRFDDRYNFPGYAAQELRRVEGVVMRGNRCRFQFDEQAFVGVIVKAMFPYDLKWLIGYEIEVSVHRRTDDSEPAVLLHKKTAPPIKENLDQAEAYVVALQKVDIDDRPVLLAGTIGDVVSTDLAAVTAALGSLEATLDGREVTAVVDQVVTPFRRLATQMRQVRSAAFTLADNLAASRHDIDLTSRSAVDVLRFEVWTRGLRENARRLVGSTFLSANDIEERDAPRALTYYRPFSGESLYRISQRFYGTPSAWELIYVRNNLSTTHLTGEELLVIPERGIG